MGDSVVSNETTLRVIPPCHHPTTTIKLHQSEKCELTCAALLLVMSTYDKPLIIKKKMHVFRKKQKMCNEA